MGMSSLYYIAPEFRENISHSQENIAIGEFGVSPYVFIWLGIAISPTHIELIDRDP